MQVGLPPMVNILTKGMNTHRSVTVCTTSLCRSLQLQLFLPFSYYPISYGKCRGNVIVAREVSKLLLEWFQNFNNSMISEPDHLPSNEFMDDQVTD